MKNSTDDSESKFLTNNNNLSKTKVGRKKKIDNKLIITKDNPEYLYEELNIHNPQEADEKYLNIWTLKQARYYPKRYLKILGYVLVISELIALLTPAVAMGIQWVTALCDGPPVFVMIELLGLLLNCIIFQKCDFSNPNGLHCILKQ